MKRKTKNIRFFTTLFTIILTVVSMTAQQGKDYNTLSEDFLLKIKNGEDVSAIQEQLANSSLEDLESALPTDQEKLAFWVNIYNGYIQLILSDTPELYNDRRDFFSREQITIAGETVSFAKIEHGIIRKSQWPLGLGLIRKWFPNKFERKLRVDTRDYRVHFALNCGAKDCPPVAIYSPEHINEQFNKGTQEYLVKTTTYTAENKSVAVTSLFSWFRGDFGSKKGVKKILKENQIIPTTKDIEITYKSYDWTLDLDNWTNL
ncbi:DUF547 domain-containing protein [Cellulophaga baltica]|uniref:DUF547 domain-containing protein n=1 Tax=Cellulophaga baltica TaxID=76594 RepID=A0A1G7LHC4_9FLAO|nr:DUF547 domain-containing protein [Cellulophaga baltica]SDF48962.1 Protein of unknown function, DUF547 [Cellulophaga baltica]